MNLENYNLIKKIILNGKFNNLNDNKWPNFDYEKVYDQIGYDGNVCGYGAVSYLNFLDEKIKKHYDICSFFEIYMPYLIGSCQASLAHILRIIELDPINDTAYNSIFTINITPEGKLPFGEMHEIAQKILNYWPNHQLAKQIINLTRFDSPTISINEKILLEIIENKKNAFKNLVLRGRYIETRQILPTLTSKEIEQLLVEIAEQRRNVCSYDYLWFLMREQGESSAKHVLASQIANYVFKYDNKSFLEDLPGLKQLIFFHTHRAAELEPENIELQEKLLNLYKPGNESFDVAEIKSLAERVLVKKPESEPAKLVLSLMKS
jgi:hypothetical protein